MIFGLGGGSNVEAWAEAIIAVIAVLGWSDSVKQRFIAWRIRKAKAKDEREAAEKKKREDIAAAKLAAQVKLEATTQFKQLNSEQTADLKNAFREEMAKHKDEDDKNFAALNERVTEAENHKEEIFKGFSQQLVEGAERMTRIEIDVKAIRENGNGAKHD